MSNRLLIKEKNQYTLGNTIKNVFEIFPKLSCLLNLRVIEKVGINLTKLKMNCKIKRTNPIKRYIFFRFIFEHVFVETAMTIKDDILIKNIYFELICDKVINEIIFNFSISEFKFVCCLLI